VGKPVEKKGDKKGCVKKKKGRGQQPYKQEQGTGGDLRLRKEKLQGTRKEWGKAEATGRPRKEASTQGAVRGFLETVRFPTEQDAKWVKRRSNIKKSKSQKKAEKVSRGETSKTSGN